MALPMEIDDVVALRPKTPARVLADITECPSCIASIHIAESVAALPRLLPGQALPSFGSPRFRMLC